MRLRTGVLCVTYLALLCVQHPNIFAEEKPSLWSSCPHVSLLEILVAAPERNRFPDVQLLVTDPEGRTAGFGVVDTAIPTSQYGDIVEIQSTPDKSTARAVQICSPAQGIYTIQVQELA